MNVLGELHDLIRVIYVHVQSYNLGHKSWKKSMILITRAKFLPRSRRDYRDLAEIGEIPPRLARSRRDFRDLVEISPACL